LIFFGGRRAGFMPVLRPFVRCCRPFASRSPRSPPFSLITRLLKLSLLIRCLHRLLTNTPGPLAQPPHRSSIAVPAEPFQAVFMQIGSDRDAPIAGWTTTRRVARRFLPCNTTPVDAYKLQRSSLTGSCSIEVIRGSLE
jgi:hypothetical protein